MTLEGVPWFVDGGEHSAEVARVLAYAAVGGKEGVIGPSDFKVVASAIPDSNIHLQPGALAMLNQYPGGGAQAYIARNVGDEVQALDPQGSSGVRYDLVAIIVQDPDYPGQPAPASIPNGPYVDLAVYKDVSSTTKFLSEVDADQTGYALARVKFDASDGTITASDITDLRQMLFARTSSVTRMLAINGAATTFGVAGPTVFPPAASWPVDVPVWANKVQLSAQIFGVDMQDTGTAGGTANGQLRVELGSLVSDNGRWQAIAVAGGKRTTQAMGAAEDRIDVPSGMRGTSQTLRTMLEVIASTGMNVRSVDGTTVMATATFFEEIE